MRAHSIRLEDIVIGERHRALADDAVDRLASSMKEAGLIQPIIIRIVEEMIVDGDLTAGVPVLVAGRHRLEAAKRLGWSHIDCIEIDDDALKAELWEIAENLHRLDLTKEQRDDHIRRYDEVLAEIERQAEVSRQNDAKPKSPPQGGRPEGRASKIAKATGLSKRTVERALNPPAQKPAPAPLDVEDAVERQLAGLMSAWNRAGPEARAQFLEKIDTPVFDRTRAAAA